MENKELEEKSLPITATEKKTKPKDPGRIAAGKKLAEHNKKAREAKESSKSIREAEIPKENKDKIPKEGSFSLTQILSVVSIVVSLAGLYYKRKELMSFVKPEKSDFQAPPIREMNSERRERRVGQIKISEEDLEHLREEKQNMEEYLEEPKKDSKLKPMD